jgi:hypothetical protein
LYYEIGICNLHPNSILLVATFIHLYEVFAGREPHFDLFLISFLLEEERRGWQVKDCWWSIPQSLRWDEESLPQLPLEHLIIRVVQEMVLHPGGSKQCQFQYVGYVLEKRVRWMD